MSFSLSEILPQLMRAPGDGIPTFSAGKGAAFELQNKIYAEAADQPSKVFTPDEILVSWKQSWEKLKTARCVVIGVPLDTGAGIRRGAAYGPRGVRFELLNDPRYRQWLKSGELIDLGDVYVNPHLLHDEMLSDAQLAACRSSMYKDAPASLRDRLPVSALSQLRTILQTLLKEHPHLRPFVIGGDHSVAWPITEALAECYPRSFGIVQPDAHTDLLPERLGVKYCFGTWSFHANELIGKDGKMVQLGIRQSGKSKEHWESTTGVKQYWASEVTSMGEQMAIESIAAHLKSKGVKQIYFSNDVDGTDESEASATGTPASEGLSSTFVLNVIERLGRDFKLVAADIMEVAPDLGDREESRKTCELAAKYSVASIEALLR